MTQAMTRMSMPPPRCTTGFSLVEMMVALAIGALTILALMALGVSFENDKRTTTGGGDAQSTGAIALYGLQRDIRQSGYGITAPTLTPTLYTCSMTLPSGGTVPVAPVVVNPATSVIPAGDANTDTLLVMFGNSNFEPQGNAIAAQSGQNYTMQMPGSFAIGDEVMAAPDVCAGALLLRPVSAVAATTITAATGTGSTMYNLGPSPSVLAYAIRSGRLTVCNYLTTNCGAATDAATWVPVADNVVSLRAQYGVDTTVPMDATVDAYSQTTPTTACEWARVSAVRLVLVARNSQYSKTGVTSAAPTWEGSSSVAIDLSGNTEWTHYRYRTLEAIVPIRNVLWLGPVC